MTDRVEETELDANGEAMMCEGCGTTRTIAAILARHGPQSIACCPERKMVAARYFWERANTRPESESVTVMQRAQSSLTDEDLAAWAEQAKRDDWHERFVGSDIRQLIGEIQRTREALTRIGRSV